MRYTMLCNRITRRVGIAQIAWLGLRRALLIACAVVLLTPEATAAQVSSIAGRVLDRSNSAPVSDATVRFLPSSNVVTTDSAGRFAVQLEPGSYRLVLEHLAYGTQAHELVVGAGRMDVEIQIDARAMRLNEVRAEVISREERERRAEGTAVRHITREELQQASERGHKFGDVVRRSGTGLRVSEGNFVTTNSDHPSRMLCIQARGRGHSSFQSSRPASGPPSRGGEVYPFCDMVPIFLDGIQLADPGAQLRDLELDNVDRIEWLSAIAATTRLGLNARNQGALLIYSRTGRRK